MTTKSNSELRGGQSQKNLILQQTCLGRLLGREDQVDGQTGPQKAEVPMRKEYF
jgi:hypothetical protein